MKITPSLPYTSQKNKIGIFSKHEYVYDEKILKAVGMSSI